MTQEEKELLIKDLCARLPYGVKVRINSKPRKVIGVYDEYVVVKGITDGKASWDNYGIEEYNIKPYLRPMSSMTEEEKEELKSKCIHTETEEDWEGVRSDVWGIQILDKYDTRIWDNTIWSSTINMDAIDWLNTNYFDCRGLIENGLAIEAPEGMYNKKLCKF